MLTLCLCSIVMRLHLVSLCCPPVSLSGSFSAKREMMRRQRDQRSCAMVSWCLDGQRLQWWERCGKSMDQVRVAFVIDVGSPVRVGVQSKAGGCAHLMGCHEKRNVTQRVCLPKQSERCVVYGLVVRGYQSVSCLIRSLTPLWSDRLSVRSFSRSLECVGSGCV